MLTKGDEVGGTSLLRTLAVRQSRFPQSMNDIIYAQHSGGLPSIAELFFAGGPTSVARAVFAPPRGDGSPRLADLVFNQDRVKGLRSVVQLVTDEEALNDPAHKCFLRAVLEGDTAVTPSIVRLLMTHAANNEPSILERLLAHDEAPNGSIARMVTEGDPSVARLFLSQPPRGKPSLASLSLQLLRTLLHRNGDRQSLLGLTMLEHPRKESLLRLLFKGTPGLLATALRGEDMASENSLCRVAVSNALVLEKGIVRFGGPDDQGMTLAQAGVAGEVEFGISVLRALCLGEDTDNPSVLRLLMWGGPDDCPLRVLLEGSFKAIVAGPVEDNPGWAWREAVVVFQSLSAMLTKSDKTVVGSSDEGYSSFLWDAARRMRDLGPEFEAEWGRACARISHEVERRSQAAPEDSLLRLIEKPLLELLAACGGMEWIKAVIKLALVLNICEKGSVGLVNKFVGWVTNLR